MRQCAIRLGYSLVCASLAIGIYGVVAIIACDEFTTAVAWTAIKLYLSGVAVGVVGVAIVNVSEMLTKETKSDE